MNQQLQPAGSQDRTNCKICAADILIATAESTGGYCMPCAKAHKPGQEATTEAHEKSRPVSAGEQLKEWLLLILATPFLLSVDFLLKGILILGVTAGTRYVFHTSWTTAGIVGAFTLVAVVIFGGIAEMPWFGKWIKRVETQNKRQQSSAQRPSGKDGPD